VQAQATILQLHGADPVRAVGEGDSTFKAAVRNLQPQDFTAAQTGTERACSTHGQRGVLQQHLDVLRCHTGQGDHDGQTGCACDHVQERLPTRQGRGQFLPEALALLPVGPFQLLDRFGEHPCHGFVALHVLLSSIGPEPWNTGAQCADARGGPLVWA